MADPTIQSHTDDRGIARITLNRPEVHNAFDDDLISRLTQEFRRVGDDDTVRAVVLAANGKSFCAGADLTWMKRMAGYRREENEADATRLAAMMRTLNELPKPVIGLIQGAAFGGGVGLVACCDIAIAVESAVFSLTEVRLGLIPAVISPYVVRAIGGRAARRYFLTAERFDAMQAERLGLVHIVTDGEGLEAAGESVVVAILKCGPRAQAAAKLLVRQVEAVPMGDDVSALTARAIADIRATPEGREGIAAFLEKRRPNWSRGG
jgi:methylglutaconyl-CoA hydratase